MGKLLAERYTPKTVIDFGCGIGSILEGFLEAQTPEVQGIEISEVAWEYASERIKPFMKRQDITKPLDVGKHDLVITLEVAEHIDPAGTDTFVQNLVDAAKEVIIFTAAPNEEGNPTHINCHPMTFWAAKFRARGFEPSDTETTLVQKLWSPEGLPEKMQPPAYYRNNLQVFVRSQ
ncbi:MAG: methyltransferase domain-containing protein [Anaerolineae bacterium]|nr:methyltransferase domain-containing protein [Anaerolineae bacterium]NIN99469.1 methyltransferase domain-containing protein [Anaerolineae bacterium]NIQ82334.1 methyltransferase domain-containing protein [Anaerolineae bacterium]